MSAARVVDVADAVAAKVAADWNPTAPDGVSRVWVATINLDPNDPATLLTGRRVWVIPGEEATEVFTRGLWRKKYRLGVLLAERYADPGDVPAAWVDAVVLWGERTLLYPLSDPALVLEGPAGAAPAFQPDPEQPPEVAVMVDRDQLTECKTVFLQYTLSFADVCDFTGAG